MRPDGKRRSVGAAGALISALLAAAVLSGESRLDELSNRAMAALGRQEYALALEALRQGSELARGNGSLRRAALFENAICGASFAAMEYGPSLKACAAAISLARQAKEDEIAGVAELNRANFLFSLGDTRAAEAGVRNALGLLRPDSLRRPIALTTLGSIHTRRGDAETARQLLRQAIELASASPDRGAEAYAHGTLGELELAAGRLDRAEISFLATFRLRKLHRLPQLESAWWKLGALKLAQNRPQEALRCFDHGLEARRTSRASFAAFLTRQGKARALEALGDRQGAREAFRLALRESRIWRDDVAPAEGLEIAADVRLATLAGEFAAASAPVGPEAWEAFEAVESTRAVGLHRQILANLSLGGRMPPDYLELVRSARTLARAAAGGDRSAARLLRAVEARIGTLEGERRMIEAGAGREGAHDANPDRLQRLLCEDHVLVSFLAGPQSSRVWVLTRTGRASAAIPGLPVLTRAVELHRNAILAGGDSKETGRQLYRLLFEGIPQELLRKPRWHVVADGPLYSVPWPSLVRPGDLENRYLIESASLEVLPAATWLSGISLEPRSQVLIAAGDVIHNQADARFRASAPGPLAALLSFWTWPVQRRPDLLELPSLAGSRREMSAVCGAWSAGSCETLGGAELTIDLLESKLARGPAVVHLATHLLADPGGAGVSAPELGLNLLPIPSTGTAFLALNLKADLTREIIHAGDISRMYAPGALIVLSSCESGRGTVLPGAGLQGFGRAWLAAGARGVVGSLWQVGDETAAFFKVFYKQLSSRTAPASALQTAQIQAIRAGGWQSNPRLWAAYMLLGKD